MSEIQSEGYHDPARHWDELHSSERFRPTYPGEPVVRFLMAGFRDRLQAGARLSALDIGVGGGRHTRLLCELGFEACGIDISAEGLKQTGLLEKLGFHPTLKRSPMTDLPFESDTFDAAIAYGVYYYGTRAETRRAISELHRVLKPGGLAFVVLRTTDDHRYGMGETLEPDTFLLRISETNEQGTVQHFLSEESLLDSFAAFSRLDYEKTETTFASRTAKNSDWLITVAK